MSYTASSHKRRYNNFMSISWTDCDDISALLQEATELGLVYELGSPDDFIYFAYSNAYKANDDWCHAIQIADYDDYGTMSECLEAAGIAINE